MQKPRQKCQAIWSMHMERFTWQLYMLLADHAFSVAYNAYGKTSVGLSTTIQFITGFQTTRPNRCPCNICKTNWVDAQRLKASGGQFL
ncbi:hypothetical protein [Bacillus litorisediminis]|uniref:hypothetical protein n=1 Tax=Bacillus litorisediminis TaxID=2922713 RepID=UPI001FAB42BA|nr:hypothetical protein [Bacillus litorisediminis]